MDRRASAPLPSRPPSRPPSRVETAGNSRPSSRAQARAEALGGLYGRLERPPSRALSVASTTDSTQATNVRVVARFRPMSAQEEAAHCQQIMSGISANECTLAPTGNSPSQSFAFDCVFGPGTSQKEVYDLCLKETVQDVLNGYNGSVLAYGQTGAGKTYTMQGPGILDAGHELSGAIPRMVSQIFSELEGKKDTCSFSVRVSYMEVYNEKVKDLLNPQKDNLPVHEITPASKIATSLGGFYVRDLTSVLTCTTKDVYEVMARGAANRTTAPTAMNRESSRSHSIFSLEVEQLTKATKQRLRGRLFLVDLAGSEKVSKSGAEGQVLEEAKNINKSLLALGAVIYALSSTEAPHVRYRDSVLTKILQDSLGGNSRTSLIICCSPAQIHASETLSSLRFGTRAKTMRNRATVNLDMDLQESPIELRRQLLSTRALLSQAQAELDKWRTGNAPSKSDWIEMDTRTKLSQEVTADADSFDVKPELGDDALRENEINALKASLVTLQNTEEELSKNVASMSKTISALESTCLQLEDSNGEQRRQNDMETRKLALKVDRIKQLENQLHSMQESADHMEGLFSTTLQQLRPRLEAVSQGIF